MNSASIPKRLGDVLEVQNGFAFDSKRFSSTNGTPLIRIRDLKRGVATETRYDGDFDPRYLVRAGDLLIGMDGEFACYEWQGEPALLNQRVCRLQGFKSDLVPRYVRYAINRYLKEIEDVTGFATVKHLSSKSVLNIEMPIPPVAEQRRIVNGLETAFAAITVARANTAQNLRNASDLFASRVDAILEQGGDGWATRRLGDVCRIARGGSPRPIQKFLTTSPEGINWIKIGDATASGKYIFKTKEKIIPAGVSRSRMVHEGDFLLSNSMSFGRPYIMRTSGCIHDGWLVLSDYEATMDQDYLYHVLGSTFLYRQFDRLAAGSTVRNLNIELASRVDVPLPPIESQRSIASHLETVQTETAHLDSVWRRKLAAIDELEQSLLNQAFPGAD